MARSKSNGLKASRMSSALHRGELGVASSGNKISVPLARFLDGAGTSPASARSTGWTLSSMSGQERFLRQPTMRGDNYARSLPKGASLDVAEVQERLDGTRFKRDLRSRSVTSRRS